MTKFAEAETSLLERLLIRSVGHLVGHSVLFTVAISYYWYCVRWLDASSFGYASSFWLRIIGIIWLKI